MMEKSPLRDKLAGGRGARMYGELTSQEGILTKRDWLSLFRYVEVREISLFLLIPDFIAVECDWLCLP